MAGILDMITPEISYRKSGKQDIAGTPLKIDSEILDAILKLNIPIKDKWKLIGNYERHKGRDQIFLDDKELFVGEGGEKIRQLGLEYNQGGEGLSGSGIYNIDTGDTDFRADYRKQMDFNKMLNNFFRRK
jgi:hypothetical protein